MYTNPTFLKTVPPNVEGRDFVVGDLHGCFDELTKLLMHVDFDPKIDRVFCTGDLIDRGPKSAECLSLLNKKWFFSVLGNHEDTLLNKLKMLDNGQTQSLSPDEIPTLKELSKYVPNILDMPLVYEVEHLLLNKVYILHSEILPEHLHNFENSLSSDEYKFYFESMKNSDFSVEINNFFNKNKGQTLEHSLKQKLLWSRKFISDFYRDHKKSIDNGDFSFMRTEHFNQNNKIFCGHNVVPFPMKIGQQYYIDTGAALGHASKEINSYLFSQFGHEFFILSMVDVTTGICYGCITSPEHRHKIRKLEGSIYDQ